METICSKDYYEEKANGHFSFTRTDIPLSEVRAKLQEQNVA
jgi:hypothetical protein